MYDGRCGGTADELRDYEHYIITMLRDYEPHQDLYIEDEEEINPVILKKLAVRVNCPLAFNYAVPAPDR